MSIGFLQYINNAKNSDVLNELKTEFEKQPVELDMEFNLSVSDLFEYNNNILFISQAGDYIKIINGKLHVSNGDDYKEVALTKYWLNEKFRKVKNQIISFKELLNIMLSNTEYISITHDYDGVKTEGSLNHILTFLNNEYKDSALADAIINGIWKIQC